MDHSGGNTTAGTAAVQWDCSGGVTQEWKLTRLPSGACTLTSVHTGLLLATASTTDGALVTPQPDTGATLRQWTLG